MSLYFPCDSTAWKNAVRVVNERNRTFAGERDCRTRDFSRSYRRTLSNRRAGHCGALLSRGIFA